MLIPYESCCWKTKKGCKQTWFTTVFTKIKNFRGQLRTEQKNRMVISGVVYEVDCNNCLRKHTGQAAKKLKERMKEHNDWPCPYVEWCMNYL